MSESTETKDEIENEETIEEEAVVAEENEETADDNVTEEDTDDAEEESEDTSDDKKAKEDSEEKGSIVKDIFEILESTLITMFVIVMIFTYLLHPLDVQGHSMNDTLQNDDKIVMYTLNFTPTYGDIIVINNDAAYLLDENGDVTRKEIGGSQLCECLIKRVIAGPGQTLKIDEDANTVTVDGQVLDEPYTKPVGEGEDSLIYGCSWFTGEVTVPEGYCFVMGDNRNKSADSRNISVGFIKMDQIYGKAVARYAPLKDFKILLFNK